MERSEESFILYCRRSERSANSVIVASEIIRYDGYSKSRISSNESRARWSAPKSPSSSTAEGASDQRIQSSLRARSSTTINRKIEYNEARAEWVEASVRDGAEYLRARSTIRSGSRCASRRRRQTPSAGIEQRSEKIGRIPEILASAYAETRE